MASALALESVSTDTGWNQDSIRGGIEPLRSALQGKSVRRIRYSKVGGPRQPFSRRRFLALRIRTLYSGNRSSMIAVIGNVLVLVVAFSLFTATVRLRK
jgi:methyl coenzyme M reductase gamma subunit